MARSIAHNAIALLIEMAEQGELDPWDVQVIDVIDRVLLQIRSLETPVVEGRAPYEADLSESGQALLYAAMLVLLKADSLARLSATEDVSDDLEAESEFPAHLDQPPLPSRLEKQLRRRASVNPPQQRRVTLQELIAQLEVMAKTMNEPRSRRGRSRRPRPQSHSKAVKTIAQLAHHENLSEIAAALEQFLTDFWPQLSADDEWIEFEHLLDYWMDPPGHGLSEFVKPDSGSEAHSEQGDRVGVFWALLYLSSQSKVELAQEQFYQDLHLRSLDAQALAASELSELSAVVLPD
ncbi:MAG: segregation/condensation protein A [Leptolyngbya sp. DLM2.Bin15]|nr:MAG: segregation/condensation protein A [Leptolyngbya sp. DLM2.Bin15]